MVIKNNSDIGEEYKEDIIELLNESVCFGGMCINRLNNYIENSNVNVLIIKGEVVGVIIFNRVEDYIDRINNNLKILSNLKELNFGISGDVYTIELLAIKESFRGKKYGKLLFNNVMDMLEGKEIIRFIWLNEDNMLRVNRILGSDFIKIGEISDYWFEEDVVCPYCSYRCRCSVVVAIKK